MRIGDPCFTSPPPCGFIPRRCWWVFADVGFISHGYPQINQIFLDFYDGEFQMPMISDGHSIPPAGRDVACYVRIMRWYLTYYHHSSADAFPADGGIFSRRWAQIKQIFWNFDDDGSQMPMTSVILCPICGICVSKTIRLRDAKTLTKSPAGGNEKPTLRKWGFWRLFALLFSGLHYCSTSYARKMSD